MEPHQYQVLCVSAEYPAFGSSQVAHDLGLNPQQVTPILGLLTRRGLVKRLDPVYGPKGWERAWAVTRLGRRRIASRERFLARIEAA